MYYMLPYLLLYIIIRLGVIALFNRLLEFFVVFSVLERQIKFST